MTPIGRIWGVIISGVLAAMILGGLGALIRGETYDHFVSEGMRSILTDPECQDFGSFIMCLAIIPASFPLLGIASFLEDEEARGPDDIVVNPKSVFIGFPAVTWQGEYFGS